MRIEPALEAFAGLVAETPAASIPAEVRAHAALVVADTVGAILGGAAEPELRRLHARSDRALGPASVLAPRFPRVEAWWAIVANGTAGTVVLVPG